MPNILERPGVRVYQKYVSLHPTIIRPGLPVVIMGTCFNIQEKVQPTDHNGLYSGTEASYVLPNWIDDSTLDPNSIAVYIINSDGEFEFDKTKITIDEENHKITLGVVTELTKTILSSSVASNDAGKLVDTTQDFIKSGIKANGKYYIVIGDDEYKITKVSQTSLEATGLPASETLVGYSVILKSNPSGKVYISYIAQRTADNKLYELASADEIEKNLGKITDENPLALGTYIASLNTTTTVYAVIVDEDDVDSYNKALELLELKEVYSLVPLSQDKNILDICKAHVDQMSLPENKKERIVLFNLKVDRDGKTKYEEAYNIKEVAESYNDKRVVLIMPDVVNISIDGNLVELPGYYLGCALGGAIAGNSPSQPFTNYAIAGINSLQYSNNYYSEYQMGIMASGGVLIFEQLSEGGAITIRHQLTTAVGSIETRELSIGTAIDFSSKFFRERMKPLIGKYNITPEFLTGMCRPYAEGVLAALKADNIIDTATYIQDLYQDKDNPDTINIHIQFMVLYPVNYINIYLII